MKKIVLFLVGSIVLVGSILLSTLNFRQPKYSGKYIFSEFQISGYTDQELTDTQKNLIGSMNNIYKGTTIELNDNGFGTYALPISENETEFGDIAWSADTKELSVDFGNDTIIYYTISLENNTLTLYKIDSKMAFLFSKTD